MKKRTLRYRIKCLVEEVDKLNRKLSVVYVAQGQAEGRADEIEAELIRYRRNSDEIGKQRNKAEADVLSLLAANKKLKDEISALRRRSTQQSDPQEEPLP